MLAVDTNVLVRYLIDDDPAQSRVARKLVREQQLRVCETVLLETEWVLRGVYNVARDDVFAGLSAFVRLPNVWLERGERVAAALQWLEQGMDFADAMHLAASGDGIEFATFDRKLATSARKAKAGKVKLL